MPGAPKKQTRDLRLLSRFLLIAVVCCVCLGTLIYAGQQLQQFLIGDARFILTPPADYGERSPSIHIEGIKYASHWSIEHVFVPDLGRSIYLLPMADRRRSLLRISWVKDASIERIWPNSIRVRVTEREPVAFVEIHVESISRWSLIDTDGVILQMPAHAPFKLPVLTGVRVQDELSERATRVHRMLRMLDDLGPLSAKVSEVDVADLDNLKVTEEINHHALVLMLGDHNFRQRMSAFADHSSEILRQRPGATVLDLRLDDRITVVHEDRNAS